MHAEAYDYVRRTIRGHRFDKVLELGSFDINGSVRDLFFSAERYHGIDLVRGPGVDEVADATSYRSDIKYDVVVCCEVLEHVQDKAGIIRTAAEHLRGAGCCDHTPGMFIITCAANPRQPHSMFDGGPLREGEWYQNVDRQLLKLGLDFNGFVVNDLQVYPDRGDLYAMATKR
jgi:hypothetical protein